MLKLHGVQSVVVSCLCPEGAIVGMAVLCCDSLGVRKELEGNVALAFPLCTGYLLELD